MIYESPFPALINEIVVKWFVSMLIFALFLERVLDAGPSVTTASASFRFLSSRGPLIGFIVVRGTSLTLKTVGGDVCVAGDNRWAGS